MYCTVLYIPHEGGTLIPLYEPTSNYSSNDVRTAGPFPQLIAELIAELIAGLSAVGWTGGEGR